MPSPVTILVVDDDALTRKYLEKVLESEGYAVVSLTNGRDALACIETQEFDLALLDLKMPHAGGMEVLAALRRQWPDTPVIVLTAHASLETSVEALRQGAHDYLFKPCKTVRLRESVRSGLLKRQQALCQRRLLDRLEEGGFARLQEKDTTPLGKQARFLKRGPLIIDLARHLITLDDVLLQLSPTEFDLLAYLISESPRIVPPQELVREVQGYKSDPWEARSIVRYHIYRIRRRIKAATGRKDVIRTIRGVGYTVLDRVE